VARAPRPRNTRVTPQGAFEKLPGTSKRWRNIATGETISDRKMSGLMRETRLRVSVSKERYTKGVKAGTFELSERAAIRQAHAQVRREILSRFPGLEPADERAIFKWRRLKMSGEANPAGEEGSMTAAEKDRIKSLFDRYEKNMWPLIRRAFGSGQSWYETPDMGAFPVAA
jgi:hypothetical protein